MTDSILFTMELALDLWYQAAKEELGIYFTIEPADAEYIKFKLYQARQDIADERLKKLVLHFDHSRTHAFIFHKNEEYLP